MYMITQITRIDCILCFECISLQKTIDRYHKYIKEVQNDKPEMERYSQQLRLEAANMVKKIELLEVSQRKLLGQGLGLCSVEELQEIENQLERSLRNIRARKSLVFKEQIEQLKAKERLLREENAKLSEKFGGKQRRPSTQRKEAAIFGSQSSRSSEVETELFIGLPENRCS
ncbi:hypothetical protein SCA6_004524 [Theobroma cacao]